MTRRTFTQSLFAAGAPATVASSAPLDTVRSRLQSGGNVTLAAIGDSITLICFHTDFRRNYLTFVVEALRRKYPSATVRMELSGNRGTTGMGLRYLDALLKEKPDVIFLMFGMNDCAGGPDRLDGYDRNLSEMVRRTRDAGATPVILTQNEIVYNSSDGRKRLALPDYMRRAVEVAKREKIESVDNFTDWTALRKAGPDWTLHLNDAIHPNLAGHRRFASRILEHFWPEAAPFHFSGLRPPIPRETERAAECLLRGPAGAQILRTSDSTWLTLSGRRRGGLTSDLVLSVCENKSEPAWSDFMHYTLSGPRSDAVFPWAEREINSGMLLEGAGRLYIGFSQTVRASLLTVDTSKPGWPQRLGERSSYTAILSPELPLPQTLHGSYQGDCEILDGHIDAAGYPAFLARDYVNGSGSGICYLSFSGLSGEYVQSLALPPGLNPAAGRTPVDFVINSGIKPHDRPWRYEGRPPKAAAALGVLWEMAELRFQIIAIPR
jgi:lysophospholipase L1-like esterase